MNVAPTVFRNAAIVVVALISCSPLINGFPQGHDWIGEIVRVAEYQHSLAAGQIPPYWANNLYGGYGSPIFLFYAPLFAFVTALFSSLINSISWSATATLVVFSLLSVVLVERMTRAVLELDTASIATRTAAYLYALSPYLLGDKLLRSANAEFIALCIAPLAFWGLFALRRSPRYGALLLSAGVCLTTLAHNLSALVFTSLALFFALVLYANRRDLMRLVQAGGSIALGVLLATWFWLPALALQSSVQLDQLQVGHLNYHENFPPLETLFSFEFYSLGPWTLIILLAAPVFLWRIGRGTQQNLAYAALVIILILLILQLQSSVWIWEHVPILPLFQFPWRLMGPIAFLIALTGALAVHQMTRTWNAQRSMMTELALVALCIANAMPQILHYRPLDADVVQGISAKLSAKAIRDSLARATVFDEYLPRGAKLSVTEQLHPALDPVLSSHPPVDFRILSPNSTTTAIEVTASEPAVIHLARWAFPVWSITLNGMPVNYTVGRLHNLDVTVPAGRSELILSTEPPRIRTMGLWISLCGIFLWIGQLMFMQRGTKK